jgi:hypothetical protein
MPSKKRAAQMMLIVADYYTCQSERPKAEGILSQIFIYNFSPGTLPKY